MATPKKQHKHAQRAKSKAKQNRMGKPAKASASALIDHPFDVVKFDLSTFDFQDIKENGFEPVDFDDLFQAMKAAETREIVGDGLVKHGAIVDECIAYQTVPETGDPTGAKARLAEQGADLITFTSGSTVDHFFDLGLDWPDGCVAGSIGPVTSAALRKHDMPPAFEAKPSDIPGLVAAIVRHFQRAARPSK